MTPKYLVLRILDGTQPAWPYFVLGARDPAARAALDHYAEAMLADNRIREAAGDPPLYPPAYIDDVRDLAHEFATYRRQHGEGDPGTVGSAVAIDDDARVLGESRAISLADLRAAWLNRLAHRVLPLLRQAHAEAWVNMKVKEKVNAAMAVIEGRD